MIMLFAYSLVRKLAVSVVSRPNRVRKFEKNLRFALRSPPISSSSMQYGTGAWKNLHLTRKHGQCMTRRELHYISIERDIRAAAWVAFWEIM